MSLSQYSHPLPDNPLLEVKINSHLNYTLEQYILVYCLWDKNTKQSFSQFKSGILLDFTAGFARIGPSLGARYVFNSEKNFNYLQLYAIWKF